MRHPRFLLASSSTVAFLLLTSCQSPRAQANIAEELINLGNALNNTQQDVSMLQETVDSLRIVVAKQDTIIGRLAALAGLPMPSK